MGVYCADIETTGLLEDMKKQDNPRLHNICGIAEDSDEVVLIHGSDKERVQAWLDEGHTLIMHNGICFDGEALKLLGYDISKIKIIDTLALSWYLELKRPKHGLESYGVEAGVPKPEIADWESLTQEDYDHRVFEDCRIQKYVWNKQKKYLKELYGDDEAAKQKCINLLMWKMEMLRQKQENKFAVDVPHLIKLEAELAALVEDKFIELGKNMPKVPIKATRKRPAKPYLKNGELSTAGLKWKELTESLGLPFEHSEDIEVVTGYSDGNPNSPTQIKSWLESLDWFPETYKYVRDKETNEGRNIPQVNVQGGGVCVSIKKLFDVCPELVHLDGLGILKHRWGMAKNFLANQIDGEVIASAAGFTNTLRLKHSAPLANMPSLRVKYGKEIRSSLVARKGYVLLGADESSLEDRLKHHFQWKLDPEYVKTQMTKGFDPHLQIAMMAGLLTVEEADFYKWNKADGDYECVDTPAMKELLALEGAEKAAKLKQIDGIRSAGKSTNYACQYGAGVDTVTRTAKVAKKIGSALHKGYNTLNWTIAKIASLMVVKKTSFGSWQKNPINGLWYSLVSDKDKFSTLIQGTGAYTLDLWVYHATQIAKSKGLEFKLVGDWHDEIVLELPEGMESQYEEVVLGGMERLNAQLKLNRELACDVAFGKCYADIH